MYACTKQRKVGARVLSVHPHGWIVGIPKIGEGEGWGFCVKILLLFDLGRGESRAVRNLIICLGSCNPQMAKFRASMHYGGGGDDQRLQVDEALIGSNFNNLERCLVGRHGCSSREEFEVSDMRAGVEQGWRVPSGVEVKALWLNKFLFIIPSKDVFAMA